MKIRHEWWAVLPLIFLTGTANANYHLIPWVQGTVDYQSECFALYDESDPDNFKTGLLYTQVAIVMQMSDDGTGTAMTEEDNTDIGTHTSPTNSTSIRFSQCDDTAGEDGTYQIELHDDTVGIDAASARSITFRITATDLVETTLILDLTVDSAANLSDTIWDELCGTPTASTVREQLCTDVDAVLVDTSTTLDDYIDTEVAAILSDTGTAGVALANDSINAAVIAADAIGASELATDAIGAAELAADAGTEIAGAVGDLVIEDQGATYSLECAIAVILAIETGEWSTSGGIATFQDPGGNENRSVGTIASTTRNAITVSCPTL